MAGSIRLHVPGPLAAGQRVTLTEDQAHYLLRVMRREPGDTVLLFDGASGEYSGTIEAAAKRSATILLCSRTRPQVAGPDVWLLFALLKRDATDLVVRQATEMGVSAIQPLLTAHASAQRINPGRFAAIATEAAEQSERLTVPRVHAPMTLDAALAGWPPDRVLFAAIERHAGGMPEAYRRAAVLIGPEGGFSAAEVQTLKRHPDVRPLSLGPGILRAETASVAALARIAQHSIEAG